MLQLRVGQRHGYVVVYFLLLVVLLVKGLGHAELQVFHDVLLLTHVLVYLLDLLNVLRLKIFVDRCILIFKIWPIKQHLESESGACVLTIQLILSIKPYLTIKLLSYFLADEKTVA